MATFYCALGMYGGQLKVIPHTIAAGINFIRNSLEKGNESNDNTDPLPSIALQAAAAVVAVMEDDAAFNAGYGSMPNEECNIEMDAAVMDGWNRGFGGVAILGRLLSTKQMCHFPSV